MPNISFLACTKVELWDLKDCIAVNGEKIQSRAVTLTLVQQCPISNLSELFSFTTMYLNFMFLGQFLYELSCTHTHKHTPTHTHTHTHIHTYTHTHTHPPARPHAGPPRASRAGTWPRPCPGGFGCPGASPRASGLRASGRAGPSWPWGRGRARHT